MKKLAFILTAVIIFVSILVSYENDDQVEKKSPYEQIEGKWDIQSYKQSGDPIMDLDGSYWNFKYSDSEEPPYVATDSVTFYGAEMKGEFTYEFSENEDSLFIRDSTQTMEYFHGDWAILNFEEDTLALSRTRYPDRAWADTVELNR